MAGRGHILARVLLGTLLVASIAHADVRTEARRHFRTGMALIAQGQVDRGVQELQAAYEILPHPNVLYNIGRAYAESGRYPEAIDYFERYLESDPQDGNEVQGFLDALRQRISSVESREGPTETGPTAPTATPGEVSADEIDALEQSATQIETLAESTRDDGLRQRAARLRALAQELRERRSGQRAGPTAPVEPVHPAVEPTMPGQALALGTARQGDTYEEQVVSSSRAAQSPLDAPNSTTLITSQDLRLSGLTNPGEALRRVAGAEVMSTSPGDVQISIRGLNQRISNRTIVLIDGRSVYLDFLGGTFWTMLPLSIEDIERIEVIRGPASALYGADAFTGIVNIITRPIGEGRSFLSASVGNEGQYRLASTISHRIDRLRFRIGAGYERANSYARAIGPDRVDIRPYPRDPNLGFDRLWANADVQLRVSDELTITAGTGVNTGNRYFQALGRLRELFLQDGLFAQTYLQAQTTFGLSARVFWNRFSANYGLNGVVDGGIDVAQQARLSRADVIDTEVVYQNQFTVGSVTNQVIGGIGYRFKEIDWDWMRDLANGNQVQTQHHFNVFLQDTLRIDTWLQAVASLRLDRHPLLSAPQLSPRGSILIHPTTHQTIRATAAYAFRAPTFVESYVQVPNESPIRGVEAFGIGNTSLGPERIVSLELGYMFQEFDFIAIELNGYVNWVYDQILLNTNTAYRLAGYANDPRLRYDPTIAAYPLGQLQFGNENATFLQVGGELGLRLFPVDGLDIYATYALNSTTAQGTQNLAGRELDQRTSAHKITAGFQYRSPIGLDFSSDFQWVSDQVWVEQVLDTANGGLTFVPFRLPSYAVLNARIGYRVLNDQMELAISGTNLLADGQRQHPFGQPIDRRVMGSVSVRW